MEAAGSPETIGKYRVRRTLGRGGMGAVVEAFDPDVERRVAIKTVHPHLTGGEDREAYLERFRREAQATARCQHPNIVSILEYGQDGKQVYLVMEYVDGIPLDRLLKQRRPGLKEGLSIVVQLLRALDRAHAEGIVHRDVKPANVLVVGQEAPLVKLTDFGIARMPDRSGLTQVGGVIGTPDYMAPEQAFGLPCDARTDLYAAGLVLHELLALARVPEDVPRARVPRIPGLPPTARLDRQAPIPASFVPVVERAIAPHAPDRFPSARAFGYALRTAATALRQPAPIAIDEAERGSSVTRIAASPTPAAPPPMTPTGTGTGSASASQHGYADPLASVSGLDEPTLTRVRESVAAMLGEEANAVVRRAAAEAISFAEFIHGVANAIPSARKRQRFLADWGL